MKAKHLLCFTALIAILFGSCVKDAVNIGEIDYSPKDREILQRTLNLPDEPFDYTVVLPDYMASTGLSPAPVSNNMATLGRVLFYDKTLSKNKTVSCASCHKQELAFSDNVAFSKGFDGQDTERNSLPLGSVVSFAAYYGGSNNRSGFPFFWDERAASVAAQSTQTIQNPLEMGMHLDDLVQEVGQKDYYKILFKTAYGTEDITEERILQAIEDFIDGMGSYESKMDKAANAQGSGFNFNFAADFAQFTAAENRGKTLFINKCSSCHGREVAMPGKRSANNGLDRVYADKGVGDHTGNASQDGIFKVPALRNVGLTAPYMHDGRFETLDDVLEHYSHGIQNHPNLDRDLKTSSQGGPNQMNFTDNQKSDIIAFLNTLTDNEFITKEMYSNPFK